MQMRNPLHVQAMAEPPQLTRHRLQLQYWGAVISALETLILRVGSLEAVLSDAQPALNGPRLQAILGEFWSQKVDVTRPI